MAISLDDPKKLKPLAQQAHQVAMNMLRPISRKYDRAEHAYPTELDMLAAMIDGLSESGASEGAGAAGVRRDEKPEEKQEGTKNGANLASVMSIAEMCWGDVGLLLSMPRRAVRALRRGVGRHGDHRAGRGIGLGQHQDHRGPRR